MNLLDEFDGLMSHLNSEENGLAEEFRIALRASLRESELNALWRNCLEGGGVDNWEGYDESLEAYYDREEEISDEEIKEIIHE